MIKINNSDISDIKIAGLSVSKIMVDDTVVWPTNAQYGGFCKLILNDGSVVELEGSGTLKREMVSDVYKSNLVGAIVGTKCTGIDNDAFNGCQLLKSVNLSNSITHIGNYSFYTCFELEEVGDVSNVEGTIGRSAFEDCKKLKKLNLSNKVNYLDDDCFWGCTELEEVGDVSNVTTCVDGTFYGCSKLKSLNFTNKLTTIGGRCFYACTSIKTFGDLSGLTNELSGSFAVCTSVEEYPTFANCTVTKLSSTFENNHSLTTITLPNTITQLGGDVFYSCVLLQSIYLTTSVPPEIIQETFRNNNAVLYVPAEALEAYQNADVWKDYYLSRIQPY